MSMTSRKSAKNLPYHGSDGSYAPRVLPALVLSLRAHPPGDVHTSQELKPSGEQKLKPSGEQKWKPSDEQKWKPTDEHQHRGRSREATDRAN